MDENKFLKLLQLQLNTLDLSKNTFILGDLNFNLLSNLGDKLRNMVSSMNFKFLNDTKPTRLSSGTLLDVVISNNINIVNEHSLHPCSFSDHCLVAIEINIPVDLNKAEFIYTRRIKDDHLIAIDNILKSTSFSFLDQINDINDKWILFKNTIYKIIDLICPKTKIKIKQKNLPWLDASTFKLKNYRDKLYKYAVKSKSIEDWNRYKEVRNKYNSFIKFKMKNYFFDKNSSFFKSSKKYWQFYKKYIKTKVSSNAHSLDCNQFEYKQQVLNDGMKTANAFNEFFTSFEAPSIFKKSECASYIFDRFLNIKKTQLKQLNHLNFQIYPITTYEIVKY